MPTIAIGSFGESLADRDPFSSSSAVLPGIKFSVLISGGKGAGSVQPLYLILSLLGFLAKVRGIYPG
jgi:hypothetical protein